MQKLRDVDFNALAKTGNIRGGKNCRIYAFLVSAQIYGTKREELLKEMSNPSKNPIQYTEKDLDKFLKTHKIEF